MYNAVAQRRREDRRNRTDKFVENIISPVTYYVGDQRINDYYIRQAYNAVDKELVDSCNDQLNKAQEEYTSGDATNAAGMAYDAGAHAVYGRNQLKDDARNFGSPLDKICFEYRNQDLYGDPLGPSVQKIIKSSREDYIETHSQDNDYSAAQKAINSAAKTNAEVNQMAHDRYVEGVGLLVAEACFSIYVIMKSPNKSLATTKKLVAKALIPIAVRSVHQLAYASGKSLYSPEYWMLSYLIVRLIEAAAALITNKLIDEIGSLSSVETVADRIEYEIELMMRNVVGESAKELGIAINIAGNVGKVTLDALKYRNIALQFPSPPPPPTLSSSNPLLPETSVVPYGQSSITVNTNTSIPRGTTMNGLPGKNFTSATNSRYTVGYSRTVTKEFAKTSTRSAVQEFAKTSTKSVVQEFAKTSTKTAVQEFAKTSTRSAVQEFAKTSTKTAVQEFAKTSTRSAVQEFAKTSTRSAVQEFAKTSARDATQKYAQVGSGAATGNAGNSNLAIGIAVTTVLSVKDIYAAAMGEITKQQLFKNIVAQASGVASGTIGFNIGFGIGSAILPGYGSFIGGLIGSYFGGNGGSTLCKVILDNFIDDDVESMRTIFNYTFATNALENNLNLDQIRNAAEMVAQQVDFNALTRKMVQAGTEAERVIIAKEPLDNIIQQVLGRAPGQIRRLQ